jgi:hypothetical protein
MQKNKPLKISTLSEVSSRKILASCYNNKIINLTMVTSIIDNIVFNTFEVKENNKIEVYYNLNDAVHSYNDINARNSIGKVSKKASIPGFYNTQTMI